MTSSTHMISKSSLPSGAVSTAYCAAPSYMAINAAAPSTTSNSPMPGTDSSSTGGSAVKQCPQCQARFTKTCKLMTHIKSVHENSRPYACAKCDDTFKRKDHLTRHVASKHA